MWECVCVLVCFLRVHFYVFMRYFACISALLNSALCEAANKNPRRNSTRLPQRVSSTHPSCGQKRLYSQNSPPATQHNPTPPPSYIHPFFMLRILQASHLTTHKKHNGCLPLLPTPSSAFFCSCTHQIWHIVPHSHVS